MYVAIRLKPAEIYALAHKSVSEREALERLNKGDKTTVTYTHRPSHNKTAVNAVNADATADPDTSEPADTSVNAVGHSKLGMQIRSEFNLNSPNSLRIRSHCEFAANSA